MLDIKLRAAKDDLRREELKQDSEHAQRELDAAEVNLPPPSKGA